MQSIFNGPKSTHESYASSEWFDARTTRNKRSSDGWKFLSYEHYLKILKK